MSVKLPFKPIFTVEFDKDLIITIQEQVKKYSNLVFESIKNDSPVIDPIIQKSLYYLLEKQNSLFDVPAMLVCLYFLERSFVKATENCISEVFHFEQPIQIFNKLKKDLELLPKDYTPVISIFEYAKDSKFNFIINLSDQIFQYIDTVIPSEKKHEYKIFEDDFHNIINNEEIFLNQLGITTKKRILIRDDTDNIIELSKKFILNLQNSKLSILVVDESFELKQFLYYLGREILNLKKKILYEKIDFFKLQFTDLFNKTNLVYIGNLTYKTFTEQYEIIHSLRETPSIVIISPKIWNKFENLKMFLHNSGVFFYPIKENIGKNKDYLEKFTLNFLKNSKLRMDDFELKDFSQIIAKKSKGSILYIESIITHLEYLEIAEFKPEIFENIPDGVESFLAYKYLEDFKKNDIGILLTLSTFATIQSQYGIQFFSRDQILKLQKVIQSELISLKLIELESKLQSIDYLQRMGNLYAFKANNDVESLFSPYDFFNETKAGENETKSKKILLQTQNLFSSLPTIDLEGIYVKSILESLKNKNSPDLLINLLHLAIVKGNFFDLIYDLEYTKDELVQILQSIKDGIITKGFESVENFLYILDYLFDKYITSGDYTNAQRFIEYFESFYVSYKSDQKVRFHFQKSRLLVATGFIHQAYQELENAIILIKQTKSYWTLGVILGFMGDIYFISQQPTFGSYSYDQVFQIHSRILSNSSRFKGYALLKLTDRFNEIGLFANSLQTVEEAVNIFNSRNFLLEELNGLPKMADILHKLGSSDLAVNTINKAKLLSKDLDESFNKRIESLLNAFSNPESFHPLYSFKNWTKINYSNLEEIKIRSKKYKQIFEENKNKELNEELLQQLLYYTNILFKLGDIYQLRLILDHIERNIPSKSANKGLLYLALGLIHNYFANIDTANYYIDLAKVSLYQIPVDYDITLLHQTTYIGFQLYLNKFEYAEFLLKDHFMRRKRKYDHYLYFFYSFLENKKAVPNNSTRFYEKAKELLLEKGENTISKYELMQYGCGIVQNFYSEIFPFVGVTKKDQALIEEINKLFYKIQIDGTINNFEKALQNLAQIQEQIKLISIEEWRNDFQITYMKRLGQIYFNDLTKPENLKKCIYYWQEGLQIISEVAIGNPLLYLFERLDLLYLIGKTALKFNLLSIEEANKYLLSGKNLLRKHNVQGILRLEFQFDTAIGTNFFLSKKYTEATKYYARALQKHENKLYGELSSIISNLAIIYVENNEKELLKDHLRKYKGIINHFNIKDDLIKKGIEIHLFD